MTQERVYRVPIRDTDELRQRFVETWTEFLQSMMDDAIDQWRKYWKSVSMQKVVTLNTCCDIQVAIRHNRLFSEFRATNISTGSAFHMMVR